MSMSAIEQYLEQPPYYGRSHVRDNVAVKKLCGPTAKFDQSRKVWSTRCEDALRSLVASKKWHPIGIKESAYAPLMRHAQERRVKAEAEWVAAAEAKAAAVKVAEEERRVKAARPRLTLPFTKDRSKAFTLRRPPVPTSYPPPVSTLRRPRVPTSCPPPGSTLVSTDKKRKAQTTSEWEPDVAPASTPINKKLGVGFEPSVAEVAECKRLGFTEEAIAYSNCCDELGPRGSLSNEGRVLRWCSFFDHDDDVQELDRQARQRSWGGIEMRYTLPERASRDYAVELNARGMKAHAALI